MNRKIASLGLLLLLIIISGCSGTSAPLGSKKNPVKIYFTPSVDSGTITTNSEHFLKFLEKETGYFFKSGIPTSYVAVVEAFGSKRADVAVMNSFGYLMANEKYGAEAKLTVIRHGETFYRGEIIAHVDSGINKVSDINGKRFAFTDPSSTSGYLFPSKILKENNVVPSNTVFAVKHDNVVTMVYQKQVDAGAAFYSPPSEDGKIRDARERVMTQFPDIEKKVKIIELTEKIANDPFVFRKDLPPELSEKLVNAFLKYISTDEGKMIFRNIYSVDGLVRSTDKDYDGLRQMIAINKINPADLMKK